MKGSVRKRYTEDGFTGTLKLDTGSHHRRACRIQKQFVDGICAPHLSQSQQHGFGVHPQNHHREWADAELLHGGLADRQHRERG